MASDVSWGYRTRPTGMSGKERRGGGVFGRRDRSYHTRRQRVAPTLRFTEMTAVEMLGRVDELTDGRFGSVDAATEGGNRSILEIPAQTSFSRQLALKRSELPVSPR